MGSARLLGRPVVIAALVCGTVLGPFAVGLATAQDDGDVADLRQEREDNSRQAAEVAAQLDELNAEDDDLLAAIEALDTHIALQEDRIRAAEQSIADAEALAATARADAAALADEMESIRDRLRLRAVEVFVSPGLDTLEQLNTGDLLEAELKRTYVDEVVGDEYELIDDLRTARAAQEEAERVARDAAAEAATERDALTDRLAELDASRREVERLRAEVAQRVEEFEAESRVLAEADAAIAQQIRDLEAELARQAAAAEEERRRAEEEARRQAEAEGRPDENPDETGDPVVDGPFAVTHRPVPGNISSSFGTRVHPIFGTSRQHSGIDFSASFGQTISAAADGVVLSAGWINGYGWTVVLSHGDGFTTLYAHQSQTLVAAGETVAGGDAIGQVGSTGYSTGPHLHFEIRVDGVAVDPAPYL